MSDSESDKQWKLGKRDMVFFAIVAAVIILLVLGTSDRKTKPVPSNQVHMKATSRADCMACHAEDSVKPQPMGHTKADQCFQCHLQPKAWGKMKL